MGAYLFKWTFLICSSTPSKDPAISVFNRLDHGAPKYIKYFPHFVCQPGEKRIDQLCTVKL